MIFDYIIIIFTAIIVMMILLEKLAGVITAVVQAIQIAQVRVIMNEEDW